MFRKLFLFIFLISTAYASLIERLSDDIENTQVEEGNRWVVLVAGSSGYYNYRHQADVLHAYQLVQKIHKIPKERIILMMYDDIAYADDNPVKGNVINYPGGDNLYTDDIQKDYVQAEVTPENFLGVLLKDKKLIDQNKKVLNSTSEDFVFIYFSDHGAPSMVAFPNDILSASDLKKTLDKMQENNSFKKMLIYIEACESGSMFAEDLDPKQNIYAVTASNFNEPSYAIFWDDERKTYLADEFSINWLLDSYKLDSENIDETLLDQYLNVKKKTNDSHVCQFGDLQMASRDTTSEFQGKLAKNENQFIKVPSFTKEQMKSMRSDEVEYYLTKMHSDLNRDGSFERLIEGRKIMNRFMLGLRMRFASKLSVNKRTLIGRNQAENRECYDELINHLHETCIPLHVHTYLYRHLYLFVNTCNVIKRQNINVQISELNEIISKQCQSLRLMDLVQLTKIV